ncbi:MAG: hypothetical protein HQK84_08885 [Nitrospinae bacterium]|nr:hypothetical protein [Nitrospinota bacterium]
MKKIERNKIKTYPIRERNNKVKVSDFVDIKGFDGSFSTFSSLLPNQLKGIELLKVVDAITEAHKSNKEVVFAMGAHVIKCGLNPIIIDLMERGIITALAFNGAGSIHDFELAYCGETSEDVAEEIKSGRFGMVEETGAMMNDALKQYSNEEIGFGEAIGRKITEENFPYKNHSLFARAYELKIPATVHVALGNDIIHMHPTADGAILGRASFTDFNIFTGVVNSLSDGVYLNIGSSVLLPEVFLKALAIARNIGSKVENFTAVNFDMIQHYRSNTNVVNRPTEGSSKGYSITGHHEIMLPLLYALLRERF